METEMKPTSIRALALQVLERNRQGNQEETVSRSGRNLIGNPTDATVRRFEVFEYCLDGGPWLILVSFNATDTPEALRLTLTERYGGVVKVRRRRQRRA